MEDEELKKILETLLFITDTPLNIKRLAQLCDVTDEETVKNALMQLRDDYDKQNKALQIMQVAGGWQMSTRQQYGLWVRKLYNNKMTVRLTQAALETLCIVAYKQPITRAEAEAIRGVDSVGPLETLTQRKLITVVGRKETLGRPILYGTTSEFLRQFGLNSIADLPKLDTFHIENPVLAAQSTAVELAEEDFKQENIPMPDVEQSDSLLNPENASENPQTNVQQTAETKIEETSLTSTEDVQTEQNKNNDSDVDALASKKD